MDEIKEPSIELLDSPWSSSKERISGQVVVYPEGQEEDELGYLDALQEGFKQSVAGVSVRQILGNKLEAPSNYIPKDESERQEFLRAVGMNFDAYDRVLSNAQDADDVRRNIEIYNGDMENLRKLNNNHWLTQLQFGLTQMSGNVTDVGLSFVNPALGASRGLRVLSNIGFNVASGVASNAIVSKLTGVEQDIASDVFGITMMSGGFHGLGLAGTTFAQAGAKTAGSHDSMVSGKYREAIDKALPAKFNEALKWVNKHTLGKWELKERILNYDSPTAQELASKMTTYRQGIKENGQFVTKLTKGDTAFEIKRSLEMADSPIEDLSHIAVREAKSLGIPKDIYEIYVRTKLEGGDVSAYLNAYPALKDAPTINKLVEDATKHFKNKASMLASLKIIDGVAVGDSYAPRVINKLKAVDFTAGKGGIPEAQKYLKRNLINGVYNSAERLKLFQDIYDMEVLSKVSEDAIENPIPFKDWLEEEAFSTAVGYLDQGIFIQKGVDGKPSRATTSYEDSSATFSFEKHRRPWNWSYRDANGFSMGDLAEDFSVALKKYNQRTQGSVAIKKTYGTDYNGFLTKVGEGAKELSDADFGDHAKRADNFERDMTAMLRRLYGMTLDPNKAKNVGTIDALSEVLSNITFGDVGTYMGLLNLGDMTYAIQAYGAKSLIKAIPYARELADRWGKGTFSKDDYIAIERQVTGGEIRELLTKDEIAHAVESQYANEVSNFMKNVVTGSRVFAQTMPGSRLLRATQRSIVSTVQETFLEEVVRKAHGLAMKGGYRGFLRDVDFKKSGVQPADMEMLNEVLRENTRIMSDSKIDIKDLGRALEENPIAMHALRKYNEYVADLTIQRRGLDDIFIWDLVNNPILKLALQFKTFALQSFNKRLVMLGNRWEEEGAREFVATLSISTALSGIINMGITGIRTMGMDEEERQKYLERVFGISGFEIGNASDFLEAFFATGAQRNPYLASIMTGLNMFGIGTNLKSTSGTSGVSEDSLFFGSSNLGLDLYNNVPSLRLLQGFKDGVTGIINLSTDALDVGDDFTRAQKTATAKQLVTGVGVAIPEIPYLKNAIKDWTKDSLEDYKLNY